jgi:hypothetical protein
MNVILRSSFGFVGSRRKSCVLGGPGGGFGIKASALRQRILRRCHPPRHEMHKLLFSKLMHFFIIM